jgi:hypothetical protein
LIFDEKKYAEEILKNGFSSFMSRKDLYILAKYFKYVGENKVQIKKSLIEFCEKYNPEFNEVLSRDRINKAVDNSQKFGLRLPIEINITESELEIIKNIGNYNRQKILFVMLAISKYVKYSGIRYIPKKESKYEDSYFINEKTTSILKMAKVNMNKIDRRKVFTDFYILGVIDSTYSGAFRITIIDELSPTAITIKDMDNMIDIYPFYCEKCGRVADRGGKKHNLCLECYQEKRNLISREIMRNKRDVSRLCAK